MRASSTGTPLKLIDFNDDTVELATVNSVVQVAAADVDGTFAGCVPGGSARKLEEVEEEEEVLRNLVEKIDSSSEEFSHDSIVRQLSLSQDVLKRQWASLGNKFNDHSLSDELRIAALVYRDVYAFAGDHTLKKIHSYSQSRLLSDIQASTDYEKHPHSLRRRLSAWTSFQAWATDSLWCGAGSDCAGIAIANWNTPSANQCFKPGNPVDQCCFRHDHGAKGGSALGGIAAKLGCDIDNDLSACQLATTGETWHAVQMVFGKSGIAMAWGCDDIGLSWEWATCWTSGSWWYPSVPYPCTKDFRGEFVEYGSDRYDNIQHNYGYIDRNKIYKSASEFTTVCQPDNTNAQTWPAANCEYGQFTYTWDSGWKTDEQCKAQ